MPDFQDLGPERWPRVVHDGPPPRPSVARRALRVGVLIGRALGLVLLPPILVVLLPVAVLNGGIRASRRG